VGATGCRIDVELELDAAGLGDREGLLDQQLLGSLLRRSIATHRFDVCDPAPVDSPLLPLDRWLLWHRRGALTLVAALAGFVVLCWIVIQLNGSFPGDSDLISWMRHPHPGEPLAFFAHLFALLGNPIVAALCVAIVWVVVDDDLGPRYGMLVLAAVSAVAFNALLKAILGPTPLQTSVRGSFASGNFPSGHVVYITSLCGLLGWFALARGHRASFAAMLLLILAMGPLRVLDGAHWPSDVLAGYALGLAWTIVVLMIGLPWAVPTQRHREDRPRQPNTARFPDPAQVRSPTGGAGGSLWVTDGRTGSAPGMRRPHGRPTRRTPLRASRPARRHADIRRRR
jgi:undecaprenyl-diphosphatase